MTTHVLLTMAAMSLVVASLYKGGQDVLKPGADAPKFSAKANDGKTYSLESTTKSGDVFLYFIKEDCPVNAEAVKYYNRIAKAYENKATVLGIFNGDAKLLEGWQKRNKASYPVAFDPELKIIRSYKAQASPWMIQVDKHHKIVKVWPGYSGKELKEINAAMAAAAKVKPVAVDLKGAPADMRFG